MSFIKTSPKNIIVECFMQMTDCNSTVWERHKASLICSSTENWPFIKWGFCSVLFEKKQIILPGLKPCYPTII